MLRLVTGRCIGYLRLSAGNGPTETDTAGEKVMALGDLIERDGVVQIMAAHSPLSAILAEEAGFHGVWASGFELSALYGLPDMSMISMTQHLDMLRAIAARTSLPVIADIDTGYGNAVNVVFAVGEYERAGAAAVVIEDKTFPKVSSLAGGGRHDLVRAEEFQGKIAAAVDTRKDERLLVIARTEALIAGLGEAEALDRAHSYVEAGADMILVHSKKPDPTEVESFARSWRSAVPLVIIPNAYPQIDTAKVKALANIRMVIYGNYAIRAATTAMQDLFRRIVEGGGAGDVYRGLVSVEEMFRLQGMDAAQASERRFLR
jgi:phosphoenolpyruvate phosphomutase